jgi:DNA (cytosine-5)-methyltransferase 1
MSMKIIPVVDLFAGPGGLSEGFSSLVDSNGNPLFDVRVSIEKDSFACETLKLRAFFRTFPKKRVPDCYYDYLRGDIGKQELVNEKSFAGEWKKVNDEVRCATLGEMPVEVVDKWIGDAIGSHDDWVLIGGPPCQAYSIVGRSRMRGSDPEGFENDKRHFLYREYLRIIREFKPAVFVMENVKGILSSTHGGSPIFNRILEDLSRPEQGLEYEIRSFVTAKTNPEPKEFVIEAEKYGIPQRRHRVILFGVRRDHAHKNHDVLLERNKFVTVQEILSGMPEIRSRLSSKSQRKDCFEAWLEVFRKAPDSLGAGSLRDRSAIEELMADAFQQACSIEGTGARFIKRSQWPKSQMPMEISSFIKDMRLGGVCQHESRSHMPSDLHRYLFAACYAELHEVSPKLAQYPLDLWPEHKNLNAAEVPFDDRFRVQCWKSPSTTVMSHMAKDGHYFIHPDPCQCRSMTVREAARLQTFPDNYFFEGNKIHQYTQVGNAVPPYLAKQLAEIVVDFLEAPCENNFSVCIDSCQSETEMGELLEV